MPRALIIVFLVLASLVIVGIIAWGKIKEYLENECEHAVVKRGIVLSDEITMIAHRGLSSVAPENTLASFKLATESGFKFVETDIHKTKDGHWVVMHDPTVDRTTDGSGAIADLTLEEIKSFKIDRGSGIENYPDEKVPTFNEYLETVISGGSYPVIEVKAKGDFDFKDVVFLLREYGITDKAIVIDYDIEHLRTIRKLCPELKMQILGHFAKKEIIDAALEIGNCGFDGMQYFQADNKYIKQIRDKGLPFNMWTVDSEAALKKIKKLGATMATTNSIVPVHSQK